MKDETKKKNRSKTKNNRKEENTAIENLRSIIVPILKEHGVVKAGIFGSFARGEAKKGSDIDILVEFKSGKSLLDPIGLKMELEENTRKKFDVLTYNSIHPLLKSQILREEVRIYEKK